MSKFFLRLGWFILILFLGLLIYSYLFRNSATFNFVFRSHGLGEVINDNLSDNDEYAVFVEDLIGGENYSLRGNDIFPAASLYKLFLMAAVLKEVENGKFSIDSKVTTTKAHLINIYGGLDTGYEQAPENITYTIEEALIRIGRVSDNFASIMLTDKIGLDKIQQMADSIGAENTKIKSPTLIVVEGEDPYISTTAVDIGKFFKKLYRKEIVSLSASEKLQEFLSLNQLDDRIPAGLPEGVKTVHKTGELSRVRHDVGIVYLPGRDYVIVLMSQNLKDESEAIVTMKNLSQKIYEYFRDKE